MVRGATRDTISELLYKRGHVRKNDEVVPLSTNQLIEETLGTQGFICIEDVVHALARSDKKVIHALKVLW